MGKVNKRVPPPALTAEARENQLISAAYDLVEQRLRDGSASSQETTHFLKAGSQRTRIEMEKMRHENEMLRAKTEALQSAQHDEEMYAEVLDALTRYGGDDDENYEADL